MDRRAREQLPEHYRLISTYARLLCARHIAAGWREDSQATAAMRSRAADASLRNRVGQSARLRPQPVHIGFAAAHVGKATEP